MRQGALVVVLLLFLCSTLPARAGPLEARALWESTKATRGAPWHLRVRALRAVVQASLPTDSIHTRALQAIAATLRKAELIHGACAFEARASRLGARRSRRRIDAELRLAKALRRELDLTAAHVHLEAVAEDGRRVARRSAEQALTLLARDAFDRRDLPALQELHARMVKQRVRPHAGIETLGMLGLLHLTSGDRPLAERAYRAAHRLYESATRREDEDALRCTKLWLDFALRAALKEAGQHARPP